MCIEEISLISSWHPQYFLDFKVCLLSQVRNVLSHRFSRQGFCLSFCDPVLWTSARLALPQRPRKLSSCLSFLFFYCWMISTAVFSRWLIRLTFPNLNCWVPLVSFSFLLFFSSVWFFLHFLVSLRKDKDKKAISSDQKKWVCVCVCVCVCLGARVQEVLIRLEYLLLLSHRATHLGASLVAQW